MPNPIPPTPPAVPADLAGRLGSMFGRMAARGMAETVTVYGTQSLKDAAGRPAARARAPLGSFTALVAAGGGSGQPSQEGMRESGTLECYYPLAALCTDGATPVASLIAAGLSPERWIVRQGDARYWRITAYEQVGPYAWVTLATGGVADAAGGTK